MSTKCIYAQPFRRQASRRGFTLIELMVTLAVLAVIAALAAPGLAQFIEQRRLTGAAEALYAQLAFTRAEAIKRSTALFFEVELDSGNWTTLVTDVDNATASEYVLDSATFGNRVALNAPARFGFDPVRGIKIDGFGNPLPGTTAFELALDTNRVIRVQVSTIGRVQLCTEAGNLRYPACQGNE